MVYHLNLGGSAWFQQFVFGFPLLGIIRQIGDFPLSGKEEGAIPFAAYGDFLVLGAHNRFDKREKASGVKNASHLWTDSCAQADKERRAKSYPCLIGVIPQWSPITEGKYIYASASTNRISFVRAMILNIRAPT